VELFKTAYANARRSQDSNPSTMALIATAMFQAGQAAYQGGNPEVAIEPLRDFVQQFPHDEKLNVAYEYLAWSCFAVADKTKSGRARRALFRQAAEAFDQLIARNANPEQSPEWGYQSAQALALAQEPEEAILGYQRLVSKYPAHDLADDSLYAMGGMQFEGKQYEGALETYGQLASQYPGSEWTDESIYAVATCYDKLKQGDKALETYQRVIERFPDEVVAANAQANIGHYHFNRKEYALALAAYRRLTHKDFPGMNTQLRRDIYRWKRDTENIMAESPYKQAVALLTEADTAPAVPSDKEKRHALGAIQQFEQLIKDYPNSVYIDHALVSIGTAYEIREEWEAALKAYDRLKARHEKKPPTGESLQQLVGYARERAEAIKIFLLQKEKFGHFGLWINYHRENLILSQRIEMS
jgi:TolA-binding protein